MRRLLLVCRPCREPLSLGLLFFYFCREKKLVISIQISKRWVCFWRMSFGFCGSSLNFSLFTFYVVSEV